MYKTTDYVNFLQAMKEQGKMSINIGGEKQVDMRGFSAACAPILMDKFPEWFDNYYSERSALNYFGRSKLERYLFNVIMESMPVENAYVTREGRFLTRFQKNWSINHSSKYSLPDEFLGMVGGILQNYVSKESHYLVDFTDVFDWDDGQFGKEDSCWWNSYKDSLSTFRSGGGWALRFYNDMEDQNGSGRCWILPKYQCLLLFNTYGYRVSDVRQILIALTGQYFNCGMEFKEIAIVNGGSQIKIPYINGGSGFLVTTSDNSKYLSPAKAQVELKLPVRELKSCSRCNKWILEDKEEYRSGEHTLLCKECFDSLHVCDNCGTPWLSLKLIPSLDKRYCSHCIGLKKLHLQVCDRCGRLERCHSTAYGTFCDPCKPKKVDLVDSSPRAGVSPISDALWSAMYQMNVSNECSKRYSTYI